ncbi:hypothetical protein IT411_02765 [Candidatus Peregrinibacteria bacterium]|nr:hypothetical protein [Candidatus Peregrinibacteria bacterium]
MDAVFQKSDAWLLLAIVMAAVEGRASLAQIVEAGDYINHAVFSDQELNGGLERLGRIGLLSKNGDMIVVEKEAVNLHEEASRKTKNLIKIMENLEKLLIKKFHAES